MTDRQQIAIVGGGVIGLSLAWELGRRGFAVVVFDINRLGRKASWAGAGILAPANHRTMTHPLDRLMGLGSELHAIWASHLLEQTGIDNGFRNCGGVYIARTTGERAALNGLKLHWQQHGIPFEDIDRLSDLVELETDEWDSSTRAVRVPSESQICNPAHLDALQSACRHQGVKLIDECQSCRLLHAGAGQVSLVVDGQAIDCDLVCLCAGAWSSELLGQLGVQLPVIPVRGQMLLYKLPQQMFIPIINEGSRYIVPRTDGHVLVGSTLEEVGFDESTTDGELAELRRFAASVVPALDDRVLVRSWAGLRPASHDGFPFIGRVPGCDNAFVATGHFKCGLQMSTATAVIVADEIQGRPPLMDLRPYAADRLNAKRDFVALN